jgi:putative acetyltransferase
MTKHIDVKILPISNNQADHLLERSCRYLQSLYPSESIHLISRKALQAEGALFIGAFVDDRCVGCIAARLIATDKTYAELKRLYVESDYRRFSIATRLINEIEALIVAKGIALVRLETGIYQPESVRLYKKLGYHVIDPFGDYSEDPLSIFMQKQLDA